MPGGLTSATCGNPAAMLVADTSVFSRWWFMAPLLLMFIPLIWIRKTEKLAFTHILSDVIIFVVIITICIYGGFAVSSNGFEPGFNNIAWMGVPGISTGISTSVLAFEGIGVVLPTRDIAADKAGFMKLLTTVLIGIGVFYIAFSQWCLWSYGPSLVEPDSLITGAMPATDPVTYVVKCVFCINLIFSYPLQLSPACNVLESYIVGGWPKSPRRKWVKNMIRIVLVTITLIGALSVWNGIAYFLEVASALSCIPLAFTLPSLFHLKVEDLSSTKRVIDWAIVVVSLGLTIFCTYSATVEWIGFIENPTGTGE
jgi:amino acid permease